MTFRPRKASERHMVSLGTFAISTTASVSFTFVRISCGLSLEVLVYASSGRCGGNVSFHTSKWSVVGRTEIWQAFIERIFKGSIGFVNIGPLQTRHESDLSIPFTRSRPFDVSSREPTRAHTSSLLLLVHAVGVNPLVEAFHC